MLDFYFRDKPSSNSDDPSGVSSPRVGATNDELEVYKILTTFLNSEHAIFWTRNNLLIVIQVALFGATAGIVSQGEKILAVTNAAGGNPLHYSFEAGLLVLFLVGLITSGGWLFMVERSHVIVKSLIEQLKDIETEFANRQQGALNPKFHAFIIFDQKVNFGKDHTFWQRYQLWTVWKWIVRAFFLLWSILITVLIFGF